MSEKVNKAIEVTYQAAGATTGLSDVVMSIYDETHALDGVNFPDVTLTEIGATGRYYGSFTPDAEGEWTVMIDSATKPGKVVRHFSVVGHDIDSVGDAVAVTDGKVDALNDLSASDVAGELATYDAATGAEAAAIVADVAVVDGKIDALNDIDAAAVNAEVDQALADYDVAKKSDIVSPAMLG